MNKLLISAAVILSSSFAAHALPENHLSKKVLEKNVKVTLALNPNMVRCLEGDYGASSLKISVPQLREVSAFRHTTRGETEPCINAGYCRSDLFPKGHTPEEILHSDRPTEDVNMKIETFEQFNFDHQKQKCFRRITEHVSADVRGLKFQHQDGMSIGESDYQTCLKQVSAP